MNKEVLAFVYMRHHIELRQKEVHMLEYKGV